MRTAIIAAIAIAAGPAAAAELSADFHGTWRVANTSGDQCRRHEVKEAPEGHMIVRPGAVALYESACRIVSTWPTRGPDAKRASAIADLTCEGEGMRWRTRVLFHLETVDGKKFVVATMLSHSATRERRVNVPTTTIYTECR